MSNFGRMKKYARRLLKIIRLPSNVPSGSRKFAAKRLWRPVATLVMLLVLFCMPVFSGTVVKSVPVAFTSQTVQDMSIELGNTHTKQAGVNGINKITYTEPKSIFNLVFGGGEASKLKEKTSVITKQPVQEIISVGTKKYQYMYCSNGTSRFYTNDQFKNPKTGFTHKSADYCAQNNQGHETQLADVPPRTGASKSTHAISAPASTLPVSNFALPSCTTTSIPYGVDYKSASWLPYGQTQTYTGINGTYFSCLGTTVQPVNEVVYTGTGQDYNALAQQEAQDQARYKCTSEYNSAKAQISLAGAADSSVMIQLQQLYNQCLAAAG